MQLGYTIPLQRHLGMGPPPRGAACDLRFCWELHVLVPGGRPSLFAAHASSRYAFLLYGLTAAEWRALPAVFAQELGRCLAWEGLGEELAGRYLGLAGAAEVTGTHGRRPVAFLNRAVDDFYSLPVGLEPDRLEQPQVRQFLNEIPCRAAGHQRRGTAREHFIEEMGSLLG